MGTANKPDTSELASPIASRETVWTTPFCRLVGKRMAAEPSGEPYYALDLLDYVSIVATRDDGAFVLVRQFRPAVEATTLELPAGHVELGQAPETAARVELAEETGYAAKDFQLVGCLRPDTGRLTNRMWVYVAQSVVAIDGWEPEPGVEVVTASSRQVAKWLTVGHFDHALHVASIYLAVQAGCIQFPVAEPRLEALFKGTR